MFDKSNLDSNKDKMAKSLHIFSAWMSKGILAPKNTPNPLVSLTPVLAGFLCRIFQGLLRATTK